MFIEKLVEGNNYKETENGAVALKSTLNPVLDFFSQCGALRNREEEDIIRIFERSYAVNPLMSMKILFYLRDIREGLGERRTFRILLKYVGENHPGALKYNINLIPEYGRFDDWYSLVGTKSESIMWHAMSNQFKDDLYAFGYNKWRRSEHVAPKPVSLLAKWIKTADASSKTTRKLGILTAIKLGFEKDIRSYKRTVRDLREYIKVVESQMSRNKWEQIDYSGVPSKAMMIYKKAFEKHDYERYKKYLEDVSKGTAKINSSTLFPYEIIREYRNKGYYNETLELQWKNLPDYVGEQNALVICDTSGSMTWGINYPLDYSVGLAIYFSQRNKGEFHNYYLEFSDESNLVHLEGNNLYEIYRNVMGTHWGGSTNLESAFDNILNTAIRHNIPQEEMPKSLIVITDMEVNASITFNGDYDRYDPTDYYSGNNYMEKRRQRELTFFETMQKNYNDAGYELPNVVFWNVNARNDTYHVDYQYPNVQLISGGSTSQFKFLNAIIGKTPYEAMEYIIDSERYESIQIASE